MLNTIPLLTLSCFVSSMAIAQEQRDILVADFEGKDYGKWKVEGEAFGPGPAQGTLKGQMPVSGYLGKRLVNSFYNGDRTTGTLTSPPIRIQRAYLNFLIGGGRHPGKTCINLIHQGKIARTASGPNDQPGGSEALEWHSWDVKSLMGKTVIIQIVDDHTGGWGHVNIDHIVQSDKRREALPARRTIVIEKRYLHLPVRTGAPKRRMKYLIGGKTIREMTIELPTQDDPEFFVFSDVSKLKGRELTIDVGKATNGDKALALIKQSDSVPRAGGLYREKHRPQFHFTSRRGWLNDPNGLVYFKGEYHLFYQHNPYGKNWGNMHWGHAVSKDLFHWRELPVAIYPARFGDWCFSGSAVVDKNNTSGFQSGREPVLIAAYTSTGRGEAIAFSEDRGRTWREHSKNPVVKHRGRDPKIVWHAPTKKWVMAVYHEDRGKRTIAFYTSSDLKEWAYQSQINGFYECPDLFELAVDGNPEESKWVLYGADGKYVLGDFDGKQFKPESEKLQVWHGNFYAAQTYDNAPENRRIQIGWGRGITFPGMPFNQQMTVPCELTLRKTADGIRMHAEPVKEIAEIRGRLQLSKDLQLKPGRKPLKEVQGELLEVRGAFEVGKAQATGVEVRGIPVVYDVGKQRLICGGIQAPMKPVDGRVTLQVLVDRGSIEVFGNGGQVAISRGVIPEEKNRSVVLLSEGGASRVKGLRVSVLRSVWKRGKKD